MTLPIKAATAASLIVAIYARYSCDKQNEDSLEDQIRRCREWAARIGLGDCKFVVYTDAAISGTDKGDALREGYRRLRADWDAGKFQIVMVDEFSRLSREPVEQAKLYELLQTNLRVRLITPDGVDTRVPGWFVRLGVDGVFAQVENQKLRYRVSRGMVGRLERGYMLGAPPFGYKLLREYDESGKHKGSRWVINPQDASIVQKIFARREKGDSMHQIAAWLNNEGIACCYEYRKKKAEHWRPSRIKSLLQRTIYKGVFVWHGSSTYAAKVKAQGWPEDAAPYDRPELRLVSDETWDRCNTVSVSRTGYGGGKHALTGIVSCGCCGATLAMSALKRCRSLYCASCTDRKSSTGDTNTLTSSVAAEGTQLVLTKALEHFISEPFVKAFRASLRQLLMGDKQGDVDACQARLKKLKASQERMARMLANLEEDDEVLERNYKETAQKVTEVQQQLTKLQEGVQVLDVQALNAQLEVDPRSLLTKLFDADLPPQELRTVLTRLFPSVVFEGKQGRYCSTFRIRFVPGVALAQVSGTAVVSTEELECRFKLQYVPSHKKEKLGYWTTEALTSLQAKTAESA